MPDNLTHEEIAALIKRVQAENGDDPRDDQEVWEGEEIPAGPDSGAGPESLLPPQGMAETCKVVFNQIESARVVRKNARIEELNHVTFDLQVVLGEAVLTVGELLNLKKDSVIVLDRLAGENAQLLVNGKALAEGEIVVLNDCFSFRINSMEEGKKAVENREEHEEAGQK